MNKNKDKDIQDFKSYEKTMNTVKIGKKMMKRIKTLNLVDFEDGTSKEEEDDEVQS